MNVYNASIHIAIFQDFVCHVCHFGDLAKAVKRNLTVNTFLTFRGAVLMPAGFNESRGNGIDPDLFWFQFFYQGFGEEVDGGFGDTVNQG